MFMQTARLAIRYDLIHGRIAVEKAAQKRGFLVGKDFLPGDLGGTMSTLAMERVEDLFCNADRKHGLEAK